MANMKKLLKRMKKAIREANEARDAAHAAANEIADLIATYHPLHAPEPESPDPWLAHLPDAAAAAPAGPNRHAAVHRWHHRKVEGREPDAPLDCREHQPARGGKFHGVRILPGCSGRRKVEVRGAACIRSR